MRFIFSVCFVLLFSACSSNNQREDNTRDNITDASAEIKSECVLTAKSVRSCLLSSTDDEIQITVRLDSVSDGEWVIKNVELQELGNIQLITGSEAVTLFEGDSLVVRFQDINFDNRADVAVSTSFGAPNLYFDYWIKSQQGEYQFVGNYPDFKIDSNAQQLISNTKSNAETYRRQVWVWRGEELIER